MYQHSTFATTCELAGVAIPEVEFPSLAALLRARSEAITRRDLLPVREFQRSVRTKRHKLIVYPRVKQVQIFDIQKIRGRRRISPTIRHLPIQGRLWSRLKSFQKELDDPLVLEEILIR